MITSAIGKFFLQVYNEKYNTQYDAENFFIKVYYPLFFDHEKYMMTAGNSPLENPKISWEDMLRKKSPFETLQQRKERFDKLIKKIKNSEADSSIAIGYPSLDVGASTSGQVSNINIAFSKADVYLSWIGSGLGVGVGGGMSILFDNPNILIDVFEGWKIYRDVLNRMPTLKGNQINTWNGQWLAHIYDSRTFIESNPMANFDPFVTEKGIISIDTQSWTKVLIAISKKYIDSQMMGYVYNYGQTNKTIGFIPFILSEIRKPIELYKKLFGMDDGNKAEKIYGTAFGFSKACQAGSIGVRAMEPKGLKEYFEKGKLPKIKVNDEEQKINFNIYQIWILAMLNNEDLWVKAQNFAKELQSYAKNGKKSTTGNSQKVQTVIAATSKRNIIEALVEIVSDAENSEQITEIASLINAMPTENVPYFLTLVRFHFAAIEK
ncbi:MAG: hypothetical protein RR190_03405 [Bacteroidales bacterium]